MSRKVGTSTIRGILILGFFLSLFAISDEVLASHYSFSVTSDCENCHDISAGISGGDPDTSYISRANYYLQNTKTNTANGRAPEVLGCTICHGMAGTQSIMKSSYLSFTSGASVHPVDVPYIVNDVTHQSITIDFYDAYVQKNIFLSNWDNTAGLVVADNLFLIGKRIACIDCHDMTVGSGSYPNHGPLYADNNASSVTIGVPRYYNPYMLRNVNSSNSTYESRWSGGVNSGNAPNAFCLATCHDNSALNTSRNFRMGHYGWGSYDNVANTIKEPSGIALKTSTCADCHETHTSRLKTDLMGSGAATTQANYNIDPTNCTAVCHRDDTFNVTLHKTSSVQSLTCTSCHASGVSHRDALNPKRLSVAADADNSGITRNYNALSRGDMNYNGVAGDETAVAYSLESTCRTCHSGYVFHSGTIDNGAYSGPMDHKKKASCLDCHDPHGKGISNGTDNNTHMIRYDIAGSNRVYRTVADLWKADGTGLCSNAVCHTAKPMGTSPLPAGANGTIMGDVADHRAASVNYSTNCFGCHPHAGSSGSFKPSCNGCHDYVGQVHVTNAHILSPVHKIHAYKSSGQTLPTTDTGYGFTCGTCHYSFTHNAINFAAGNYWDNATLRATVSFDPSVVNVAGSYDNGSTAYSGTCTGVKCHGAGMPLGVQGTDNTPKWDNTSTGDCGTCHKATVANPPVDNTHPIHAASSTNIGYGYTCNFCHVNTTNSGTTISSSVERSYHVNMTNDVFFGTSDARTTGALYSSGTCTNLYCHSNGTLTSGGTWGSGPHGWPVWGTSLDCSGCHGSISNDNGMPIYPNGTPKANSHTEHVAIGYDCRACHYNTVNAGGTTVRSDSPGRLNHVDMAWDVVADNVAGRIASFSTPTCTTISCHANSSAVWGGSAPGCSQCHLGAGDREQYQTPNDNWYRNVTTAVIDNTEWLYSGHGKASDTYDVSAHPAANFQFKAGANDPCVYCHDSAVLHDNATNPFRLKNQTGVAGYSALGWNATCLVCHSKTITPVGYVPASGYTTAPLSVASAASRVDTAHYGMKHPADNTAGGKFCWDCHDVHGDRSNSTTGNIYMIQRAALVKTDGVYGYRGTLGDNTIAIVFQKDNAIDNTGQWASSSFNGICQVCHANLGASNPANYYTQGLFGTHNRDRKCTTCHDHGDNFWASCNRCHGDSTIGGSGGMPPHAPDASGTHPWASRGTVDNNAVPAGIGDHRNVPGVTGLDCSAHTSIACSSCHTSLPGDPDQGHDTGKDNAAMTRISTQTWYNGATASWSGGAIAGGVLGGSVTDDSCMNIVCHSPYYLSNAGESGTPSPYRRYWLNQTLWDCYTCHAYDGTTATSRPATGSKSDNTMSTGVHLTHVDNNHIACNKCHSVPASIAATFTSPHKNGFVSMSFVNSPDPYVRTESYDNGATLLVPTDDNASAGHRTWFTCSNVYCHSKGQTASGQTLAPADYVVPRWDNETSGNCGTCHGGDGSTDNASSWIASGSHTHHVNTSPYAFACSVCHNGYGRATTQHADNGINLAFPATLLGGKSFASASYSQGLAHIVGNGFGSCSVNYCHGTGTFPDNLTGGANQATGTTNLPTWGNSATSYCGSCHGAPNATTYYTPSANYVGMQNWPTSGFHSRHVNPVDNVGPRMTSCSGCHTAETISTHVDGKVDFRTAHDNATVTTLALTQACDHCHGTGVAAAKAQWDNTSYSLDCLTCHGATAAYTYDNGTGLPAPNMAGDGSTYGANYRGHGRASVNYTGSGNSPAGKTCSVCHNINTTHINNVNDNTYAGNRLLDNVANGGATVTGLSTVTGMCKACHATTSSTATAKRVNTHGNDNASLSFKNGSTHDNNADYFAYACEACHEPHGMTNNGRSGVSANIYMTKVYVEVKNYTFPTTGADNTTTVGPIYFETTTGDRSYDDNTVSANTNKFCVACHISANRPGNSTSLVITGGAHTALDAYNVDERRNDCASCHNHNLDDNIVTNDGLMPQQCNACHSYPGLDNASSPKQMSPGHRDHVGLPSGTGISRGYACTTCHYAYSHNQAGIQAGADWATVPIYVPATHLNVRFESTFNPGSPTYGGQPASTASAPGNGGTGVCALLYCHGNGTGQSTWGGTYTAPAWNNTAGVVCGTCHLQGTTLAQGNHPAHMTSVFGPLMVDNTTCSTGLGCHTAYGLTPASTHVNKQVSLRNNPLSDNSAVDNVITVVCRNCHTNTVVTGQSLTGEMLAKNNWDNTTYKLACTTCHNGAATQYIYGTGNKAANVEATYYRNGHGAGSIDNGSTVIDSGTVDRVPPVRCEACHDELSQHIGAAKDALNPYRIDNTVANISTDGGIDAWCLAQCHTTSPATHPARHAYRTSGAGAYTAQTKDNTVHTHPTMQLLVPTSPIDKARWQKVPTAGVDNIPVLADMRTKSDTRDAADYLVCVSCHDPHGVDNTALTATRVFSGINDNGFQMLRYNITGQKGLNALCSKCHQ